MSLVAGGSDGEEVEPWLDGNESRGHWLYDAGCGACVQARGRRIHSEAEPEGLGADFLFFGNGKHWKVLILVMFATPFGRCSPAKSAVSGLCSSLEHLKLQVQDAGETAPVAHQYDLEATEHHPQPRHLKRNLSRRRMMSGKIRLQSNMIHMT